MLMNHCLPPIRDASTAAFISSSRISASTSSGLVTLAGPLRVNHGRLQALVAQQNLNGPQIDAAFDQMRRETVTKRRMKDER